MVAKKDFNAPKHLELDVSNLEVIKACQSLTSKGFVSTQFSWQYYYYTLTDEGLNYLREFLHLPAEVRLCLPRRTNVPRADHPTPRDTKHRLCRRRTRRR